MRKCARPAVGNGWRDTAERGLLRHRYSYANFAYNVGRGSVLVVVLIVVRLVFILALENIESLAHGFRKIFAGRFRGVCVVEQIDSAVNSPLQFGLARACAFWHRVSPFECPWIGKANALVLGVLFNVHIFEFLGPIRFADALQERDGLSLLSLRLLSGDLLRHGQILNAGGTGQMLSGHFSREQAMEFVSGSNYLGFSAVMADCFARRLRE